MATLRAGHLGFIWLSFFQSVRSPNFSSVCFLSEADSHDLLRLALNSVLLLQPPVLGLLTYAILQGLLKDFSG